MEKILVATDLSSYSTSAIHFAYRLSQLKGAKLVIVYVYYLSKPKSWRSQRFENYCKVRNEYILTKLTKFLDRVFSAMGVPFVNFEIDLQMNPNEVTTILKCVEKHKCTYMCICTQEAGELKQSIGRLASKLIAKAPVPIFCVPGSYRTKSIERICYASDMTNYQKEIKKIIEFVKTLRIEIGMLHVASTSEILPKKTLLENRLLKRTGIAIRIKYTLRTTTNTLIEDIDIAIKKIRPSLVVFFLSRSKHYVNSILNLSNSSSLSFVKKIPMLIYKK